MPNNIINLNTFANGSLAEQMNNELQNIIDNIDDPNTNPTTARKLTVEIVIKPNQRRNGANVQINTKSKLAPIIPTETTIIIDRDIKSGRVMAAEIGKQVAGQIEMDLTEVDTPEGNPGVIDLKKIKEQNKEVAQ